MSIRTISTTAVALGALALPVTASARPIDQPAPARAGHSAPIVVHVPTTPERASAPAAVHDAGGAGTLAIVAIAGGTLLAGAATGFGGGRALSRRAAVREA